MKIIFRLLGRIVITVENFFSHFWENLSTGINACTQIIKDFGTRCIQILTIGILVFLTFPTLAAAYLEEYGIKEYGWGTVEMRGVNLVVASLIVMNFLWWAILIGFLV